jgi:hypothetical protein
MLAVRLGQPADLRFTKQKQIKLDISHCLINGNALTSFMIESVPERSVIVIAHLARVTKGMRFPRCRLLVTLSQMIESSTNLVRYDFEKFKQYGGCFKLEIQPREGRDGMQSYQIEDREFSIVGGCYIHRLARSILANRERNGITCLMTDTTWSVMRPYATAFMVAVAYNTQIPLGFAFRSVETHKLDKNFQTEFQRHFNIDLSKSIVESDQGSGLKGFCESCHIVHRIRVRHFLVTLIDHVFAVYVTDLMKCKSREEFIALSKEYYQP